MALRTLRVQQALQNSRKNTQETLGVAEAFDDIRLQLTNNRIDTEELKLRLGPGIAEPLRKIADADVPRIGTPPGILGSGRRRRRGWPRAPRAWPKSRSTKSCWP